MLIGNANEDKVLEEVTNNVFKFPVRKDDTNLAKRIELFVLKDTLASAAKRQKNN